MWFKEHKTAVIIGAAAIVAVALAIVIGILIGKGAKKPTNTTTEEATGEKTESTTESTTEKKAETADSPVEIQIYTNSTWGEEGNFGATYEVSVTNKSSEDISEWTAEVDVPDGSSVQDKWGCNAEVSGTKLTISGADWGASIPANGGNVKVGFNMNSKSSFEPKVAKATVNGKDIGSLTAKEETTEATTETTAATKPKTEDGTPFDNHGALSVKGTQIVDKNGEPYQLKGVSTHGIAWFPDYVNADAFRTIRDDWGGNVIRIAMYTDENGGYCSGGNKEQLKKLVDDGVNAATELGMYVIIDWHILHDLDPKVNQSDAEAFFAEMSAKYANYDNVLYEICNEPNGGTTWDGSIRPYAETIIPIIRKNAPDAIIIVGTPNWSQDVDIVADDVSKNPLKSADGKDLTKNVMYAVHFYAATHTDAIRSKVTHALDKGVPVFISEFSICDASGNGANDYNQAQKWFDLLNDKNLSYCSWSLSNKAETSALISSNCNKLSDWSDDELSETGRWIRDQIRGK